jgi:hypothetical protein
LQDCHRRFDSTGLVVVGAFDEEPLFEKCGHSSNERDPAHGLDPTDEFIGLRYLLPLCADHIYGGWTHRLLCGRAVCKPTAKTQQDKNRRNPVSHLMLRLWGNASIRTAGSSSRSSQ